MGKLIYIGLALIFFVAGVWIWKVKRTGLQVRRQAISQVQMATSGSPGVLVKIDGQSLTTEDVEWEYRLHTAGLSDESQLTPIPDITAKLDTELSPLKTRLLGALIERKVLVAYIKGRSKFNLDDPARYTVCLSEWKVASKRLDQHGKIGQDGKLGDSRLRDRLCERSVINQFLNEEVFSDGAPTKQEVSKFYLENSSKFQKPARVTIRQILLGDEKKAKRIRYKVTKRNFEAQAREHSISPESNEGGALGPFAKGEMPPVFDIAFRMSRGRISPIMKSPYGFHIILLEEKHRKTTLNFEQAVPHIEAELKAKHNLEAYGQLIEEALTQVDVSIPAPLW